MQRECHPIPLPPYPSQIERQPSPDPLSIDRTAALRELYEETGYGSGKAGEGNAAVGEVSDVWVKDPG